MLNRTAVLAAATAILVSASTTASGQNAWMPTNRTAAGETPATVGRGRVQVEVDMFSRSVADKGALREYVWNVGTTTAKVGVSSKLDLQMTYRPYSEVQVTDPGVCLLSRTRGAGDIKVGGKYSLAGNNGGSTALAVVAFVTVPTHAGLGSDRVEGGVVLPLEVAVAGGFTAGLTTTIEYVGATAERSEGIRVSQTASIGRRILDGVAAYAMVKGHGADQPGASVAAEASGGLTLGVSRNLHINAGASMGLGGAGKQSGAYLGFAIRR